MFYYDSYVCGYDDCKPFERKNKNNAKKIQKKKKIIYTYGSHSILFHWYQWRCVSRKISYDFWLFEFVRLIIASHCLLDHQNNNNTKDVKIHIEKEKKKRINLRRKKWILLLVECLQRDEYHHPIKIHHTIPETILHFSHIVALHTYFFSFWFRSFCQRVLRYTILRNRIFFSLE